MLATLLGATLPAAAQPAVELAAPPPLEFCLPIEVEAGAAAQLLPFHSEPVVCLLPAGVIPP